jgi:exodeoxyribonuclease VIII
MTTTAEPLTPISAINSVMERFTPSPVPGITRPEPGVYRDIPESIYHGTWDLCSNSRLTTLNDSSPAHVREGVLHPSEPTPALILGSAVHCYLLTPDLFPSRYVMASQCVATKKTGERCSNPGTKLMGDDWYCGVHLKEDYGTGNKIVLSSDQWETCQRLRDSIAAHPEAAALTKAGAGDRELSVVFHESTSGVLCKMRADIVRDDLDCIVDLKTTDSAHPRDFEKSIFNFGYFRQAAFYQAGLALSGRNLKSFAFIACEKVAPYAVAVYEMRPEAIALGWNELEPLFKRYAECEKSGVWPAFTGVNYISLPAWAIRREIL